MTLGYGDFQPASNSGKPFLVFWSLLAVPTLTILISDMGDTVVKSVKDVTIWFGEVTVLPSDEGSTTDRLKHGIYKATMGRVDARAANSPDVEEADDNDSESGYQELHPGLTRAFRGRNEGQSRRQDRAAKDRLAADFARSERIDEDIARGHGDRLAEGNPTARLVDWRSPKQMYTIIAVFSFLRSGKYMPTPQPRIRDTTASPNGFIFSSYWVRMRRTSRSTAQRCPMRTRRDAVPIQ